MKLASHNSWSYLPPMKWWMRPFAFMAKCQSKTIREQYEAGVRLFDLRVRFNKEGYFILAHGLMEYRLGTLWESLNYLNEKKDCYVRVLLETSESDTKQEKRFRCWCDSTSFQFDDITFIGGQRKFDWEKVYDFKTKEPAMTGFFSSMDGCKLNDLWPWLWARIHNKEVLDAYKDYDGWVMMDFI